MKDINIGIFLLPGILMAMVGCIVIVVASLTRPKRQSMSRADEMMRLYRDNNRLLEELVAQQKETNRLLAGRPE